MARNKRKIKRQCKSKVRHATKEAAYAALKKTFNPAGRLHVYKCPHCNGWHVGHDRHYRSVHSRKAWHKAGLMEMKRA